MVKRGELRQRRREYPDIHQRWRQHRQSEYSFGKGLGKKGDLTHVGRSRPSHRKEKYLGVTDHVT